MRERTPIEELQSHTEAVKGRVEILWKNGDFDGSTELLPLACIFGQDDQPAIAYSIRLRGGGFAKALCKVARSPGQVDLDYEPYPKFNEAQGIYLGVMRLSIDGQVRAVYWKGINEDHFRKAAVEITTIEAPPGRATPYILTKGNTARKALRLLTERPEQDTFRRMLFEAYGGVCCVSGCFIPQALDAAHIDPYSGEQSNHPQNGFLLRRDLHSLFDSNLLAVDPITRLVHFASEALDWEEYANWHKRVAVKPPVMEPENLASSDALKRRWKIFVSNARKAQGH